jgi:hypothetical protein
MKWKIAEQTKCHFLGASEKEQSLLKNFLHACLFFLDLHQP